MSTPVRKREAENKAENKTEAGTATKMVKVQTSSTGRRFVDLKEVIRDELRRIDESKQQRNGAPPADNSGSQ